MKIWLVLLALLLSLIAVAAWGQAIVVPTCGSAGLRAGTTHFLTINPNGGLCSNSTGSSGGGGTGCASVCLILRII